MEITDHILLNMLKTQLVDMYRAYTDNPYLLRESPKIKFAYDLLVKADTSDKFKYWLKRASISDFSFTGTDGIVYKANLLGEFIDLAMEADDNTIETFAEWKKDITPETIMHFDEQNIRNISKVLRELEGKHDAHIVICGCGSQWIAVDTDAERLFEIFGWQPGYILSDGCTHVAFMYITKYGLQVLDHSPYTVEYLNFPDMGMEIVSDSFLEDETSGAQQMLDYLRIVQNDVADMSKFVKKDFPIMARHGTHSRLLSVLNMHIKGRKITTRLDIGEDLTIADGSSWRLDELGLPVVCGLGNILGKA